MGISVFTCAQNADTLVGKARNNKLQPIKPEILSGGFIDIAQTGQMNASARLFKLYIGQPGKWSIPVSIYSGVSANNFSGNRQNDNITLSIINPGLGLFNMSFDGNNHIAGNKTHLTTLQLHYQLGLRYLAVYSPSSYRSITFYNFITGLGFTIVTGAWERSNMANLGVFWINFRALYSTSPLSVLKDLFQQTLTRHILGHSIGIGIDITQTLNVRAFCFRFMNNRNISVFTEAVFQVAFNYSIR